MKNFLIFLFLFPSIAQAGTYWVHPDGTAANWAACSSVTDPGGTCVEGNCANYCTLTQANTASNTTPGDIIKLKGGTYNTHIFPGESGTAEARITYEAVTGETPVIINTTTTYATYYHGINLVGRQYITVRGVTVGPDPSSTMNRLLALLNGSSYNEIDSCLIYGNFRGEMIKIYDNVLENDNTPCTNNWIHDSTLANNLTFWANGEGVKESVGLQIGDPSYDSSSNSNTIERNTFRCNGHHHIETFTFNNVIRDNFIENAPCGAEALALAVGTPVCPPDSNTKYSHRNIQIYGEGTGEMFNLIESNRFGPSGAAPENDGGDGFTLTAQKNILRYNSIYSAQNNGILLKYGDSAAQALNNRIYNNTITGSGRYDNREGKCNWQGANFRWYGSYNLSGNIVKNNILYGYGVGGKDWTGGSVTIYTDNTVTNNLCTDAEAGRCSATGDPLFVDGSLPAITSTPTTTDPNLALQSGSPAINGGTSLTLANGAGDSNATLHVDDALYFQDGTWGSSLSNIQADWIAIGTVTNVVQISSIDYATNTITLASPMTWADDAPIWLYKKSDGEVVLYGSAPDYGAHEYQDTSPTTSTSHASGSFNLR